LSNQNRLQCCISKNDSCRGQAVRNLRSMSECHPYRSRDGQVDNGPHQKSTAQNICTTFLLNDTSEARTIAVAWLQGTIALSSNSHLSFVSTITSAEPRFISRKCVYLRDPIMCIHYLRVPIYQRFQDINDLLLLSSFVRVIRFEHQGYIHTLQCRLLPT